MAYTAGKNIVTDGLIVMYDLSNPKCFTGEPTINAINSVASSYPSVGNGWGTYNVNQYGAGDFFSIGTVSAINNSIVTMSASHSLRTYDVMRPQSSSGGVTANVDYYIKKHSSMSFSLHPYNASQDGTYGFSVLDSITYDMRIPISASIPTKWWGYPHMPNSGLIKTIVRNGFNGHDCLRMNFYRPDGVTDAMAYGVTPTLISGSVYTYSFYHRAADQNAVGKYVNFSNHHANPGVGVALGTFYPQSTWNRHTATATALGTGVIYLYWFVSGGPCAIDIAEIMIESSSYARPFTPTTRSLNVNTGRGGLYDLSNNGNHAALVSSGSMFDTGSGGNLFLSSASGDFVQLQTVSNGLERTVDMVYKVLEPSKGWGPFHRSEDWRERVYPTVIQLVNQSGSYYSINLPDVGTNIVHTTYSYKGSEFKAYSNGVLQGTTYMNRIMDTGSFTYQIGYQCGGSSCVNIKMHLYSLKMYNRALSDAEVRQNFNATKDRYGL